MSLLEKSKSKGQAEESNLVKRDPTSKNLADQQVRFLIIYYLGLIAISGGFLYFSLKFLSSFDVDNNSSVQFIFAIIGIIFSGSLIGNVLYSIRMLYRFYIPDGKYNPKWFGKYLSGPWEAAALAVIVIAIIQSNSFEKPVANTIDQFDLTDIFVKTFSLSALVGFGIREVVGWLGKLVANLFPTEGRPKQSRNEIKIPEDDAITTGINI